MTSRHRAATKRRSSRKKMHQDRSIQGVAPRIGSSGAEQEEEATTPRVGTPGKMGPKAKEEQQEDAERHQREGRAVRKHRTATRTQRSGGKEHLGTTRKRSRRKKHMDWTIQGVTLRSRSSGAQHSREATTPGIDTSVEMGPKKDKQTPSGNKEKEEPEEDAPR